MASSPPPQTQLDLQPLLRQALDHQNAGRFLEATQGYIQVLRHRGDHWPTYYNLAIAFQGLGRLDDARLALERALAINPKAAVAFNNLGNIHKIQNKLEDAERAYKSALSVDPNLSPALYNLALVQQARQQFSASAESLARVVELTPNHDEAWDALYRILLALKRGEEGLAVFLRWEVAIGSSPLLAAAGLALCRHIGGEQYEARYLRLAIDWPFAKATAEQLAPIMGMIQYFDVLPEEIHACYKRFDESLKESSARSAALLPRRSKGTKLRIGYVSADFRRHVMGHLMKDVFDAHDRSRFELTLVSLCETMFHDAHTSEFKALADRFIDVSALSDFDAAKFIAEADLDILVDLAGQTMGVRPAIYAHRPARCLVTHLGYHGCLGLSSVDYKFTDHIADLPEMAQYQIERPYLLDACLFPFRHIPSSDAEEKAYLAMRVELGFEGKFVFGTFVNILKLSPRCLRSWKQILDGVPNALVAFSPISSNEEAGFLRLLQGAGIDVSQIKFIPSAKTDGGQRARYLLVDAVLDTFPYAGGDTTLAALDRDVPVVSLVGKRNAERVGASILTHVGVTETLCYSEEEYIRCAVRIAQDEKWRSQLRARLQDARRTSPFFKTATHTRALERAYFDICAKKSSLTSSLTAQEFSTRFQAALRAHQVARDIASLNAVAHEYQALSEAQPEFLPLFQLRASIAKTRNQPDVVLSLLRTANELAPHDASSAVAYASLQFESNRYREALATIDAVQPSHHDQPGLLALKARVLMRLGRFEEALPITQLACSRSPNDPAPLFLYATVLATIDRNVEALAAYRNVLALKPDHPEATLNAAQLLMTQGEVEQAENLLRRALQLTPPQELAYSKLADLLKAQEKIDAWAGLAKIFTTAFPKSIRAKLIEAEGQRYLANLAAESRQIELVVDQLISLDDHNLLLELAPSVIRRSLVVNLPPNKVEKLRFRFDTALASLHDIAPQIEFAVDGDDKELRVGFLIDALGDDGRSRAAITLVNYYAEKLGTAFLYVLSGNVDGSALKSSYGLRDDIEVNSLVGLGAVNAASQLRKSHLNVLIDLCGLRHPLATQILVQRVALLQVSNGAFSEAAESSWYDLRLFDSGTKLPLWDAQGPAVAMMQSTALIPLPPPSASDDRPVASRPAGAPIVFAIGSSIDFLSAEGMSLWRTILERVPNGVLAVPASSEPALRHFQRILGAAGVAAHRIVSRSLTKNLGDHLAMADLILDNKPASDPFLALECLRAGLPLVSARGPTAHERLAYSVLLQADLSELVAESGSDYIQLAVQLANDGAKRADIREKMLMRSGIGTFDVERDVAVLRLALNQARMAAENSD
jgi:protein O-GlcNAc transferase